MQGPPPDKNEPVKKYLDLLEDKMYVCCLGVRKFAISKSLLLYLEYDLEELAVQTMKYRSLNIEY